MSLALEETNVNSKEFVSTIKLLKVVHNMVSEAKNKKNLRLTLFSVNSGRTRKRNSYLKHE